MSLIHLILYGHAIDLAAWLLLVAWAASAVTLADGLLAWAREPLPPPAAVASAPTEAEDEGGFLDLDCAVRGLIAAREALARGDVREAQREFDRALDVIRGEWELGYGLDLEVELAASRPVRSAA